MRASEKSLDCRCRNGRNVKKPQSHNVCLIKASEFPDFLKNQNIKGVPYPRSPIAIADGVLRVRTS
jgi:hypothetical protein